MEKITGECSHNKKELFNIKQEPQTAEETGYEDSRIEMLFTIVYKLNLKLFILKHVYNTPIYTNPVL